MSVEEIKQRIVSLSSEEQSELSAFLFHLRHRSDPERLRVAEERLADRDPSHWLTIEEFERRLDEKQEA
ncbi:MAG TPA: hypothetical protein VGO11_02660 [Chthoniobacteraceae bacterium]|jgi:hypothetical protein|nr:hypothetical protein [Chthoniobacteraceae bacterium]